MSVRPLKRFREPEEEMCSKRVSRFASRGEFGHAEWVLLGMRQKGIPANTRTYTSLMSAYARARGLEPALEVFKEMLREKIPPNEVTFNVLTQAAAQKADIPTAQFLFQEMKKTPLHFHPRAFNNLIRACRGSVDAARPFYEAAKPNLITFNSYLNICATSGDLEAMKEVLSEMKKQEIEPDVFTLATLIKGCNNSSKGGHIWLACHYFRTLTRKVQPDICVFTALFEACAKAQDPNQALFFFKEMRKKNLIPDTGAYTNLISSCIEKGDLRTAEFFFMQTQERSPALYTALLDVCASSGDVEKALFYLSQVKTPDLILYTCVLKACAEKGDFILAAKIYEEMQKNKINLDSHAYNILIATCIKNGCISLASRYFKEMKDNKNIHTFINLLRVCSRLKAVPEAAKYYSEAIERKMSNKAIHGLMVEVYMRARKYAQALELFHSQFTLTSPLFDLHDLTHGAARAALLYFKEKRKEETITLITGVGHHRNPLDKPFKMRRKLISFIERHPELHLSYRLDPTDPALLHINKNH